MALGLAQDRFWLWLGGGVGLALAILALALWAVFGPQIFLNALTSVWTCF
jgi:hypothetical protein